MKYSLREFRGGTHVPSHKEHKGAPPLWQADAPTRVYLAMSQHIGAPARLCVAPGDEVRIGQMVGEAQGFVSAHIHASVSGKVLGMEKIPLADGRFTECLALENDGLDSFAPGITAGGVLDEEIDAAAIIEKMKNCGVVGLGGAAFPTHIKYLPDKNGRRAECVILNGIECEPYLTNDYRNMLAESGAVLRGLTYLMRAAGTPKGYIAIEDNKKDAYQHLLNEVTKYPGIEPVLCREKYPQGAEKQLIYSITGKEVPTGGLPLDVGVIVDNIGTAIATAEAVERNCPIFERPITVAGSGIRNPGNYMVRIGTLYEDVARNAGGVRDGLVMVINGGPMMGFAVPNLSLPVLKNTTALLFMTREDLPEFCEERHCVRCARCLEACPMFLMPTSLMHAIKRKDWQGAERLDLASCLECGACSYVCPSHIPLAQYFKLGKQYTTNKGQGAKNPDFAR